MCKVPFSLSLLAAAIGIAGCVEQTAVTAMRQTDYAVTESTAAGPGSGTIESIMAVGSQDRSAWRLGVRMDDGRIRTVDTLGDGFAVGKRVAIEADGRVSPAAGPVLVARSAPSAATGGSAAAPAYESRWVTPRSGLGRVESLSVVPNSAGFISANSEPMLSVWQIGTRMDDGTLQLVNSPASGLSIGSRVRITSDGNIARVEN